MKISPSNHSLPKFFQQKHGAAIAFVLIALIVFGVSLVVIYDGHRSNDRTRRIYSSSLHGVDLIGELQYQTQEARRQIIYALTTSDSNLQITYVDQSRAADEQVRHTLTEYLPLTAEESQLRQRFEKDWADYLQVRDEIIAFMLEGEIQSAVDRDLLQGVAAFNRVRDDLVEIKHRRSAQAEAQLAADTVTSNRSLLKMAGILFLTLALAAIAVRTIQHQMLFAVSQSEARLRQVINSISEGMMVVRQDGRLELWNGGYKRGTSNTSDNFRDRLLLEAFPEIADTPIITAIAEATQNNHTVIIPETLIHEAGQPCWYEFRIFPFEGNVTIFYRDITERRQAEETVRQNEARLRAIINSIDEMVFEFDQYGTYLNIWTTDDSRLLRSREEMIGHRAEEIFGRETIAPFLEVYQRIIRTGKAENLEYPLTIRGKQRWFLARVSPIPDASGAYQSVCVLSREITERHQAEEALQEFAARLERSNRELQDFAYVASHDLQEPLRKVQTFGDRLKSRYGEVLGETGVDYLDRMRNAAGRMQVLIEDLLTFSRVATKARPFVSLDLGMIVRDVVADLEIRIERTAATIEIGELPCLDADPTQMRQVMQNLISNALKFHRPDVPPIIRIEASVLGPGEAGLDQQNANLLFENRCQLTIADNGIGFDEKYLDRIFTIFQRLHGRSEYEGTGVGLAVVRKIVERHGGTITARATPGQGATFIVTLPLRQENTAENATAKVASTQ